MNYTNAFANKDEPRAVGFPLRAAIGAALASAWFTLAAPMARAVTVSYDFSISSNYSLLVNPQSSSAQGQVKQLGSGAVNTANNNPVIMITNTSATAEISNFMMTITDPNSVYNALKLLQNPLGATPGAPFTNNVWGGPTKTIDIALPTALAPNQSLVFAVNLGPVGGFPNPSWVPGYQNIFFNQPSNMNAQLAVMFFDPASPSNVQTFNSVLPPLTEMDPMITVTSACCSTPPTSVFQTSFVVPEPTSAALVALGSLPLGMLVWRKRNRAEMKRGRQNSRRLLSH
jgi:hypothetical protein